MGTGVRITEASMLLKLRRGPRFPVSTVMPLVLDTRGREIERAIAAGTGVDTLPEWVAGCRHLPAPGREYMAFTYTFGAQSVDCVYRELQGALTVRGIKYHNLRAFASGENIGNLLSVLDTDLDGGPITTYKATVSIDAGAPWGTDPIAEVITNSPDISQIAAVSEEASTLGGRSLFLVSVQVPHGSTCARATIRHDESDGHIAVVTMSKLPSAEASEYVSGVIRAAFAECYGSASYAPLRPRGLCGSSEITHLRGKLPELFVNNYTRECPVLPIMLSSEQARLLEPVKRVIWYPRGGDHCRAYTAPDGYYVGLKKNRLENRGKFPYLVTGYMQDHMLMDGSETHSYYSAEGTATGRAKTRPSRPVPRALSGGASTSGYVRRRAKSFVDAVERATRLTVDAQSLPWCPQVVKQEMFDVDDDTIMSAVRSGSCGPSAYRYFEELLGVSIHTVAIDSGVFKFFPEAQRRGKWYMWEPPHPGHVVVFEAVNRAYGKARYAYDFMANGSTSVFDGNDPVVSRVTSGKSRESLRPSGAADAVGQLLDDRGRCRVIVTRSSGCIDTLTRPLTVPVVPNPVCFLDLHIYKMNVVKHGMGIGVTHLYKRSNQSTLYFSNDASFRHWLRVQQDAHVGRG